MSQGASTILRIHKSFQNALMALFPDIGLQKSGFHNTATSPGSAYYDSIANQREFFVKFAQDRKFEPTAPEKWYSVVPEELLARKVPNFANVLIVMNSFRVERKSITSIKGASPMP